MRYAILAAAVAMQACLGATYSWSVYVARLKELAGIGQGAAQLPFTVFYLVFPATTILAGSLIARWGPRACAIAGGLLFGLGWMAAGFGDRHFAFTVLGIGGLAGVGVGLAYVVPIAACVSWFPRHKGLVTGVAVAGFGGGAALVAQLAGYLMREHDLTPFGVFRVVGALSALIVGMAGLRMRMAPGRDGATEAGMVNGMDAMDRDRDGARACQSRNSDSRSTSHEPQDTNHDPRPTAILTQPVFALLYFAMFTGLMAGFAVNANLKEIGRAAGEGAGIAAVGWFAVANAAGRIIWGWAFDRTPSRVALAANLALQAALLLAAGPLQSSAAGLQAFALIAGFNYGGVLVLYAATVARRWGASRVAGVYGWLFSSNMPASLAPVLAGLAFDHWGSFVTPLTLIALLMLAAALLTGRQRAIDGAAPPRRGNGPS